MRKPKLLQTARETIEAIGGTFVFAGWLEMDPRRVSEWKKNGFPSHTFINLSRRLKEEKRLNVSPRAWGITPEGGRAAPRPRKIAQAAE
jgi:hypothetical protein